MGKPHKTLHVLNWFYGNICTRKCYSDVEKQLRCKDKMLEIIKGHENYMITHKMFIKVMREKHNVCDISEELFRRSERDFYRRQL